MKGKLAQAPSLILAPLIRTPVSHLSLALTLALTIALTLALALALLEEESRHRSCPYGLGIPMPSLGTECRACHI